VSRGKSMKLLATLPRRYRPDFMARLDKRTIFGQAIYDRYQRVTTDLGGIESLSTLQQSLVRRLTWFEVMIEGMECRMAQGEQIDIGSWTQLVNTWLGIARTLGLERKAKRGKSLHELMAPNRTPVDVEP
jgi:hypothetical protein